MEGSLYIWYISRKEGECMKNNEALITYVELSLKECDAYAIKWHEKDLHNDKHITSSKIIAVNLKTNNMYVRKSNGEVSEITPKNSTQK